MAGKYEDNQVYMALVNHMKDSVVIGMKADGNQLGAVMLMADVATEVLLSLPREQRLPATELLITRLENSVERRMAKGAN